MLIVAVCVCVATLLFFLVLSRLSDPVIKAAMGVAYVLHLLVTFHVLPHIEFLFPDVTTFHAVTVGVLDGGWPTYTTDLDLFIGVQALLYLLFEHDYRIVSVFNSLVSVLLVIPILSLAKELFEDTLPSDRLLAVGVLFPPPSHLSI